MGVALDKFHNAASRWARSILHHFWLSLIYLPAQLFEHRFVEWANRWIDEHAGKALRMVIAPIFWISTNPLGITGILVIMLLVFVFVHAYLTSHPPEMAAAHRGGGVSESGEPPYYARWVLVIVIVIVGVWLMSPHIAGQPFVTRVLIVGIVCAVVGVGTNEAFLRLASADEVIAVQPEKHASSETIIAAGTNEMLAQALDDFASAIENSPPTVIGQQIIVSGGQGSGSVIGKRIVVTNGPASTGTTIGEQVTVSSGGPSATPIVNPQKASALRDAAARVRTGQVTKAEIRETILQSRLPASMSTAHTAMSRALQELQSSTLP